MLRLEGVRAGYGNIAVLKGVSFDVPDRAIVTLLGANGAGKTTTVRTIAGLTRASAGSITFDGQRIDAWSADRMAGFGIALVPQGRLLFPELTVEENLELGAYSRKGSAEIKADIEKAYVQFPILKERRRQDAGTMSGGQQQMLAIARALMSRPKLLILDEPSLGLAPRIVAEIFEIIVRIRAAGTAILLVEQNAHMALDVSDHGHVMESGHVRISGRADELLRDPRVREAYLGHGDA
ncbi:MAG TPA: ABC transporter ATP-binding protein [Burkholderiaceae bacterium]|nr:ABC transporter ATP-binding protein [Burkholderiaceae bacterium]